MVVLLDQYLLEAPCYHEDIFHASLKAFFEAIQTCLPIHVTLIQAELSLPEF